MAERESNPPAGGSAGAPGEPSAASRRGRRTSPPPLPGRLPPLRSWATNGTAATGTSGAEQAPMLLADPPAPAAKVVERARRRAAEERAEASANRDPSLWPLAWLVALVLVPLAAFLQQYTLHLGSLTLENAPEEIRHSEAAHPPDVSDLVIQSKFVVKEKHHDPAAFDWGDEAIEGLEPMAVSRTQRLRLAIVAGEVIGREAALERLEALETDVMDGGVLAAEVGWLQQLYGDGPHVVPEEVQRSLVERHGWFGRLALAFSEPDHNPLRWEVVSGYRNVLGFMIGSTLGLVGLFLLGVFAIVVLAILAATVGAKLHFEPPDPGGSVYLEMFNVFVGGFALVLALFLFLFGLHAEGTTAALVLMEIATWGLFVTVLYPVVIGRVPLGKAMRDLGLHRGSGFFKEIGCGIVGHIAGIPIVWFVILAAYGVGLAFGGGEEEAQGLEGYPIFQSPMGDTWLYMWIGIASTVIWAPVLEEIIFRGALYRHLRSRLRVPLAVLTSAAVFGLVHPYTTAGMVQVAFSGLVFALLREWRGSLIAPITAHALHNGTIVFIQMGMLMAID